MSDSAERRRRMRSLKLVFYVICILASSALPLKAQYQGYQFLGFDGLQAGTQPAQGYYLTMPLYYGWFGISIYGPQGNLVLRDATSAMHMFVVPNFEVITPFKILGASYGASFTQYLVNGRVDVAALNFKRSLSYNYGDIYITPVLLGWHLKRADITAGYAFFIVLPENLEMVERMWLILRS